MLDDVSSPPQKEPNNSSGGVNKDRDDNLMDSIKTGDIQQPDPDYDYPELGLHTEQKHIPDPDYVYYQSYVDDSTDPDPDYEYFQPGDNKKPDPAAVFNQRPSKPDPNFKRRPSHRSRFLLSLDDNDTSQTDLDNTSGDNDDGTSDIGDDFANISLTNDQSINVDQEI